METVLKICDDAYKILVGVTLVANYCVVEVYSIYQHTHFSFVCIRMMRTKY